MKLIDLLQKYAGEKSDSLRPTGSNSVLKEKKTRPHKVEVSSPTSAQELLDQKGITVHYIADPDQIDNAIVELIIADVTLGLDIETAKLPTYEKHEKAGLDPHLSCIRLVQLYANRKVYIFDVDAIGIEPLEPLWDLPMVAHNAVFEMKHLMHAGVDVQNLDCTMLMANALNGNLPGLDDLTRDQFGLNISKKLQTSNWNAPTLSKEQLAYAALDAVLPHWLYYDLIEEMKSRQLRIYALMKKAQKAVAKLELNGFNFDLKAHRALLEKWEQEKDLAIEQLSKQLGEKVNPNSGKQLSDWFEANLDSHLLKSWPKTKNGQLKTDAETLANYCKHPIYTPLLHYKKIAKLHCTYGEKFANNVNPATGRIHASFKIGGTNTGRFSCSSPNMQNLPRNKDFRALFSAPQGRVLVVADYNQIELRVAALVSRDPALLEAYEQGQDLHEQTAATISKLPIDQVTKEQRQAAKAVNYGLLFGQGAEGLVRYARDKFNVNMTIQEAQAARTTFFKTYPQLASWQKSTGSLARSTMLVRTPGGRDRNFTNEKTGYHYTEAINTPIQGGAAEVLLAALSKLEDNFTGMDAILVNTIHDELVVEAAEKDIAKVMIAVERAMVEGMLAIFPEASTRNLVEINTGANWAEAK